MTMRGVWLLIAVFGVTQGCNLPCYEGCQAMNSGASCLETCGCTAAEVSAPQPAPVPPPTPNPLTIIPREPEEEETHSPEESGHSEEQPAHETTVDVEPDEDEDDEDDEDEAGVAETGKPVEQSETSPETSTETPTEESTTSQPETAPTQPTATEPVPIQPATDPAPSQPAAQPSPTQPAEVPSTEPSTPPTTTEPTLTPPTQPSVSEPTQSPPTLPAATEPLQPAQSSPQPEPISAQPTTAGSQSSPLIMLSQSAECQRKCEDVCPRGGACLTACSLHFCGIVQETEPWPLLLMLAGALALLGCWVALRIRWRKAIPGAERRPLLSQPLDL